MWIEITIRRIAINMNDASRGYICLSASFSFILLTYIGLYEGDFYNPLNEGLVTYQYALEAISFFFSIIFGLLGCTYIYGDAEKEFPRIAIASISLILVMNLRILINLVEYINSLI
jgi:hypothetical protein